MSFLLSICIPTRDRASYLEKSLQSIVQQEFFTATNLVEIVISDNCSSDNTVDVCRDFINKYPGKIKYSKNEENLYDLNFELALGLGSGSFLKIMNDNVVWATGSLEYITNLIKISENAKPLIFFLNNVKVMKEPLYIYNNVNDFMDVVSHHVTWMGGFGIWKSQFDTINDFSRKYLLSLVQVDVLLRLINSGIPCVVDNLKIFYPDQSLRKGNYNVAKVFGNHYLEILNEYKEKINPTLFSRLKEDVFLDHIVPCYFSTDFDFYGHEFYDLLGHFKNEAYYETAISSANSQRTSKLGDVS
jgi:glycosyltransferase involved in cell wall biosynthesis